ISKQSVQQVYAKGTGAECREVVQKLNQARGQLEENQKLQDLSVAQARQETAPCESFTDAEEPFCEESYESHSENYGYNSVAISSTQRSQSGILSVPPAQSKWQIFLEDS
ncbi:hypothetical protein Ocin01_05466, partial [Orchesella cincta]